MKRMIGLKEVISADRRCSNHTLKSFGICLDTPVLKSGHIDIQLNKVFKTTQMVKVSYDNPVSFVDPYAPMLKNYTVKAFVENHPTGHFYIGTSGHAMALHNGVLVDTYKRGPDSRKVKTATEVLGHDKEIEFAFEQYRREHPENIFTEPTKRRSKYRYHIIDIVNASGDRYSKEEKEQIYKDLIRIARENDMGKEVDGEILLSEKESVDIVDMYLDGY